MIDFLITSTLSLSLLYVFYILVLEREKMHQFNRYYLLFSLIFSLVLPLIKFKIYVQTTVLASNTISEPMPITLPTTDVAETTNYLPFVLWSIYFLITAALLVRFSINLLKIKRKVSANPSQKLQNATLVLLPEPVLPHTFLNYIFINKFDFENRKIEEELYTHEQTHVNQKHTFDILLIELMKTIFWFNPLLHFYKKAIQLNHEFLADEKVVQFYNNVPFYQSLLLEKASWNNNFYLASNLNYLVTKKRLIMMTKTTSKEILLAKKLLLVPILTGMIYFFCLETIAQTTTINKSQEVSNAQSITEKEYFKNVRFKYYSDIYKDANGTRRGTLIFNKLYEELTDSDKNKLESALIVPKAIQKQSLSDEKFQDFKNKEKYAIWIDDKYVSNDKLSDYKASDFAYFNGSSIYKNARTAKHPQPYQFSLYTNSYFDKNQMGKQKTKYGGTEIVIWGSANDGKEYQKYVEEMANRKATEKKAENTEKPETPATEKIVTEFATETVTKSGGQVYTAVEKRPEFPGGIAAFYHFVGENFTVPQADIKGKVIAQFVIEKDGSLTNIKVLRDLGNGTGEEAVRVLKLSPNWIPGEQKGEKVNVLYNLPISIIGSQSK